MKPYDTYARKRLIIFLILCANHLVSPHLLILVLNLFIHVFTLAMHEKAFIETDESADLQFYELFLERYGELKSRGTSMSDAEFHEMAQSSAEFLRQQPKLYTAVNSRIWVLETCRDHKIKSLQSRGENAFISYENMLRADLLLMRELQSKTLKSYELWRYRKWLINEAQSLRLTDIIRTEVDIIKDIIALDYRNFHAWGHYRWLMVCIEQHFPDICVESRLSYARRIIEQCFGNYSAWHERAVCIERSHDANAILEELSMIQSAMYCDPFDPCAFKYAEGLSIMLNKLVNTHTPCAKAQSNCRQWFAALIDSAVELIDMEDKPLRFPLRLVLAIARYCSEWEDSEISAIVVIELRKARKLERFLDAKAAGCTFPNEFETAQAIVLHCLLAVDPMRQGAYRDLLASLGE